MKLEQTQHDLVNLEILNDAELLNNLSIRFLNDLIYTFVGPTLLAVNPFAMIPAFASEDFKLNYIRKIVLTPDSNYKSLLPHSYALAAEAFNLLNV